MTDTGLLLSKISPIVESDNITLLSIALTRISSHKGTNLQKRNLIYSPLSFHSEVLET